MPMKATSSLVLTVTGKRPTARTSRLSARLRSGVGGGRLTASGFTFRFPEWADAARDLCQRWRDGQRNGT